ncbi:uncharacterized protein K444DRAFT_623584 [Hyaloscypha bicolor E]|uniref:Uncharacterized protein n=1 Tax=Hyaloscypha bicolor E TaxID=1095630 RepID=A0A2J6TWK3_9HELO|nr:uncharacterized protein K444DRAFT_623584 [Hyaloscypha bicolor E]PMD67406.1 hypothetical protein K444DRAFT_623584 [Hyaloscypha bicolor E]
MPGTGRPFPAGQKCTPKGLATTSNSTALYGIIVDAQGAHAHAHAPIQRVLRVGVVAGRQTIRGANFATYQRENPPISPISLAAQLQYLPTRKVTQPTRDIFTVLGRVFLTHRLFCAHPSSATRLSVAVEEGNTGHSSEKPSAAGIDPEQGQPTSKLPLPLKLPRSCTVDFLPFVLAVSAADQRLHMHM